MIKFLKRLFVRGDFPEPPEPRPAPMKPVETAVRKHDDFDYIVTIGENEFIGSPGYWRVLPEHYKATHEYSMECTRLLKKAKYEGVVK